MQWLAAGGHGAAKTIGVVKLFIGRHACVLDEQPTRCAWLQKRVFVIALAVEAAVAGVDDVARASKGLLASKTEDDKTIGKECGNVHVNTKNKLQERGQNGKVAQGRRRKKKTNKYCNPYQLRHDAWYSDSLAMTASLSATGLAQTEQLVGVGALGSALKPCIAQ